MNDGTQWIYGYNFVSIAVLKFFSEMFTLSKLFATVHSIKHQTVSSFHGETHKFTIAGHIREKLISTVKERSHIANAHLKIIR